MTIKLLKKQQRQWYNTIMNKLMPTLFAMTIIIGIFLSSTIVSAESKTTTASVTVPEACTMTSNNDTPHAATLSPNTYSGASGSNYENGIGKTTLTVVCNDYEGFAIYAIGYTGNSVDSADHTKLVGNATGSTISTKVYASGDHTSNWSMKVNKVTDSTITYNPQNMTILDNYNSWHTIPSEYDKVAEYKASTGSSTTDTTLGAKLETTYAAYIAENQSADTYVGQVKYALVHPSTAPEPVEPNQIGVLYDGNGLFFDQTGTKSTNRVVYEKLCEDEYGYIADTPTIMSTSNFDASGNQTGPYYTGDYIEGSLPVNGYLEFEGASRIKIVLQFALGTGAYANIYPGDESIDLGDPNSNDSGSGTFVFEGNYVSSWIEAWSDPAPDYDFGVYAEIYPIYDEPTAGASYNVIQNVCSYHPAIGSYATPVSWDSFWFKTEDDYLYQLYGEESEWTNDYDVLDYLKDNGESLLGTTITLKADNPYRITYNGNGATTGTMNGFYTSLTTNTGLTIADLMAPNYKKSGYGFAGWSTDQNATINSNSTIYGPNETIDGASIAFDPITREAVLYAVWVPSSGIMQNFTCSSLNNGQVTALADARDDNVYTVGKMQDGNCWMMENLRLDTVNSSDATKAQGYGGVFTGLANPEIIISDSTVANSKYSTANITGNNRMYRFPRYNNNNTNIGGTNPNGVTLTSSPGVWNGRESNSAQYDDANHDHNQWYSYGNLYTWSAAIANTDELNNIATSELVNTSICPNNWSLPYGGTTNKGTFSGGFYYLETQMNNPYDSSEWRSYPNNFIYASLGDKGFYWSRSSNTYFDAHALTIYNDRVSFSISHKDSGHAVRCLSQ